MNIPGFDIPALELTEDQKLEPITIERIREFHYTVGEDFLDNCEIGDRDEFSQVLLENRPELSDEIEDYLRSDPWVEIPGFNEVFCNLGIDYDEENDISSIYHDYVDYCNNNEGIKSEVNTILYSVADYYK